MTFDLRADGPMDGRTVVITGGTRGIGRAAASALAEAGAHVIVVGRVRARVDATVIDVESLGRGCASGIVADYERLDDVRDAAASIMRTTSSIDVLINNAGAIYSERLITDDGFERTFQVNYLAGFLLTAMLAPALRAAEASRVITVSSDAHLAAWRGIDFDDVDLRRRWGSFPAYANSKLADIMFAGELARRWADAGVASYSMHPGVVRTGFGRTGDLSERGLWNALNPLSLSPEQGADTMVYVASTPSDRLDDGAYYYKRRPKRASRPARDPKARQRLWEWSAEALGLGTARLVGSGGGESA